MRSNPVSLAAYWVLVRENRNFRRLWTAQIVSEIGDWFYALAIYNLLLQLTGSAASVGLAVVLQVLPQTFIGPTAGVVNDRSSRKRVMIAADLVRAAIVLGMLLVSTRSMVWLVYPLLLVETLMAAFFEPARNAVIPNVTSDEGLLVANTLSSVTWSFNLAIGATLGGITAVLLGRGPVFVLNSLSFLASAWLISRMRFAEPHLSSTPPLRGRDLVDFSPILEGARYMRRHPRLFATVFVKAGLGFMGANNVILPLLGERVFPIRLAGISEQRGAMLGMSLLMGARGVGSLLGPFVAGSWAGESQARLRSGILVGFLMASLGYVSVGLCGGALPAIVAVIVAHAGSSTVWVFSTTLLQMYTEDRYRGRVFAAELGLGMLTISVSSYLAGLALDLGVSAQRFSLGMGLAILIPAAVWMATLRRDH